MNKALCVLFGGAGFIGSHLTEELIKKNYSVAVFARGSKWDYENLSSINKKINFIKGDFGDRSLISKIIKRGDIVFDLVASSVPFSSMQSPIGEITNHIFPHVQLIKLACKKRAGKIIFFSSGGGVYGEKSKLPVLEDEPLQPVSPHAISKVTIEYFLDYFSKIYNTPYIIYRLSNPYGPRQIPQKGFGIIPTLFSHVLQNEASPSAEAGGFFVRGSAIPHRSGAGLRRFLRNSPYCRCNKPPTLFNNGKLIRDFIYIEDVINAIVKSFYKKTKYHIYNIGSGKGTSLNNLWQKIKKITKTKLQPIFKPKRPIDVNAIILDINRFKKEFRWRPKTDLPNGLKKTWNAYRMSFKKTTKN